ncbi:MAG: DNA recombination protein RmuC [Alistipes sp.]|nr:DNA recombination protein RmuC [Alistipes sp.]
MQVTLITIICIAALALCAAAAAAYSRARRRADALGADLARAVADAGIERSGREAAERAAEAEREARGRAEEQVRILQERNAEARERLAAAEERERVGRENREQVEEAMKAQFRNLASDIFTEQSRNFRETSRESMDVLLKPFRDNMVEFRERVERIHSAENEQHGELRNELRNLMELNRRITAETTNLTNALRGNSKVQGDWGEMILETILDGSNLIKGVHYRTQMNIKNGEGENMRPDVVLYLPEGKHIVIDSKVSLTAYVNWCSAEDDAARRAASAAHVASVRQHVAELGRKEYQRLLESPDFVIMFIPNEPAFLAALQADSSIWADAYDRKVIISSPTNLFALLKLVDDLWKRNAQSRNTADIVACGTKLYEQLASFVAALEGVGASLDKARTSYDEAYKRLCTGNDNLVRVGERMLKLGLPAKRRISPRALEAAGESGEEPVDSESNPSGEAVEGGTERRES